MARVPAYQPSLFGDAEPSIDESFTGARRIHLDSAAWSIWCPPHVVGSYSQLASVGVLEDITPPQLHEATWCVPGHGMRMGLLEAKRSRCCRPSSGLRLSPTSRTWTPHRSVPRRAAA
jgi:hypothetical protein